MKQLLKEMERVISSEKYRAQKEFGDHYHSAHEGYGVLCEELFEAEQETLKLDDAKDVLLADLHANATDSTIESLRSIAQFATHAACEYVQVAAVALKTIESLEAET